MIDVTLSTVCDYAYIDPQTQKLSILGIIRFVWAPQVPTVIRRLCIAAEFEAPWSEVRHGRTVQIELVDQDGTPLLPRTPDFPLGFQPLSPHVPNRAVASLVLELDRLPIRAFGTYTLHVYDGTRAISGASFIVAAPQPPAAPASGT